MNKETLTLTNALDALNSTDKQFVQLFTHGSLEIELYAPKGHDPQQPHLKDEVYIIAEGEGWFVNGDRRHRFTKGQVLFVPAGVAHRFENFSDDFATWVIFYGPKGGEQDE